MENKELTYQFLKENYPKFNENFHNCVMSGGISNLLFTFEDFENLSIQEFKGKIIELKKEFKNDIMEILSVYGVENGGEWVYCECLDICEDGTINTDGYFGITSFDVEDYIKKNFHEDFIYFNENFNDIKGL